LYKKIETEVVENEGKRGYQRIPTIGLGEDTARSQREQIEHQGLLQRSRDPGTPVLLLAKKVAGGNLRGTDD